MFDPSGVSGSTLRLLDLADGHVTEAPVGGVHLDALSFGPADRWLAYAADGTFRKLSLPGLKPDGPEVAGVSLAWPSPDGAALATVDLSAPDTPAEVRILDTESIRTAGSVRMPDEWEPRSVALSAGGRVLAVNYSSFPGRPIAQGAVCWEVASGRELLRVDGAWQVSLISGDGGTLLTKHSVPGQADRFSYWAWDLGTGTGRSLHSVEAINGHALLSPSGRTMGLSVVQEAGWPFRGLARKLGLSWPFRQSIISTALFDMATGEQVARLSGVLNEWSPDGSVVTTMSEAWTKVKVWDVPPPKPLGWFLAGSALWSLPVALVARRRVRRLGRLRVMSAASGATRQ